MLCIRISEPCTIRKVNFASITRDLGRNPRRATITSIGVSLMFCTSVSFVKVPAHAQSHVQSSKLLTQVQTIPLDRVEGRIDHLGLDAKGNGNDTVVVVDLTAGKVTQRTRTLRTDRRLTRPTMFDFRVVTTGSKSLGPTGSPLS